MENEFTALIGDVGGTNVRLTLRRLNLRTRTSIEIKPLTKLDAQKNKSFEDCVKQFLSEFEEGDENWPKIGCVGIAGEVKENSVCTTNIPHWPVSDGKHIASTFKLRKFDFINDFNAAGHGICLLKESDTFRLNRAHIEDDGVKVVMGPGTGLGEAFLCKSKFADCHEVFSAEGGHTEWSPRSDFDFRLYAFAKHYIETSENTENLKTPNKPIERVSVERVCAGPGLPLIYEFMKLEHPSLPRVLETGDKPLHVNDIVGKDILQAGLEKNDELCMKVVDKFTEIFAVETGDVGLKYLPYGGIYLVGGVTIGITDYIRNHKTFIDTFYSKGRCEGIMRRLPIMIVKPDIELGILGAEEACYRQLGCFKAQ